MTADALSPGGAGPVRSVKMPTIDGRRFGSANPVRCSEPVVGSVSPTKVAKVPASDEVISIRGTSRREIPGAYHTLPRHARDHHIAVGDVDALTVDVDEQRLQSRLLAVLGRGAQHRASCRRHRPDHVAGHRHRHADRHLRNQRRGNVIQLTVLRPVQCRGGLHDGQQRRGDRQHKTDEAGDRRHPPGDLHIARRAGGIALRNGYRHGRALIGPLRLQPNTRAAPWSMTALGASDAGTTRS